MLEHIGHTYLLRGNAIPNPENLCLDVDKDILVPQDEATEFVSYAHADLVRNQQEYPWRWEIIEKKCQTK